MNILVCHLFKSVTAMQLIPCMKGMGHKVVEKTYYTPQDLYEDDKLDTMVEKDIDSADFDVVFTVNFWPPVARACQRRGIKYIAWSYDSPQNLPSDQDMELETNYIFIFDKEECLSYNKRGIDRVFHMLLATDTSRWDAIKAGKPVYDITLVGRVYESTFPSLIGGMDEYDKGYSQAIIAAQRKIIGYYLIDELLSDERINSINKSFSQKSGKPSDVSRGQLSYSIGSYITYQDRLTLLRLLQNAGEVQLFSDALEPHTKELLKGVHINGRIEYETEMPKVFKESKINLNPVLRVIKSGIPQRALDIMGCNAFMLSSYQPELLEHFVEGESCACYYSLEDAHDKASFYLQNDDIRTRIASAGYEIIKRDFTYENRLSQMFEKAGIK